MDLFVQHIIWFPPGVILDVIPAKREEGISIFYHYKELHFISHCKSDNGGNFKHALLPTYLLEQISYNENDT